MKKFWNVFSVIFLLTVHSLLCLLYKVTYYSGKIDIYSGFRYYFPLMVFFLGAPLLYWTCGRLFSKKVDKKVYSISVYVIFGMVAVFAVVSFFVPEYLDIYASINAPSYMYYLLFADSVKYIAVPSMAVSALFPAVFSRIGCMKRQRTNNEITMEEVEEKLKSGEKEL